MKKIKSTRILEDRTLKESLVLLLMKGIGDISDSDHIKNSEVLENIWEDVTAAELDKYIIKEEISKWVSATRTLLTSV